MSNRREYKKRKKLRKKLRDKGYSPSRIEEIVAEKMKNKEQVVSDDYDEEYAHIQDGLDYLSECGDR